MTHTPTPWFLEIGEDRCFHEGNAAAIVDKEGFTIAEFWPAPIAINDAQFVIRCINERADLLNLAQHIVVMANDAHLSEHPEWQEIVKEADQLLVRAEGKETRP